MPTHPDEVAGALPPPSGRPLPADLTPPPPPPSLAALADSAAPGPTTDPGADETIEVPVTPRRRINPDVVVPVGAWPEGTWDPVPEPEPVDPAVLAADEASRYLVTDAVPPARVEPVREPVSLEPLRPVPAPERAFTDGEPALFGPVNPRDDAPVAETAPTIALPPTAPRAGLLARQPRWAKIGGAAAVLFAATAAIGVAADRGGDGSAAPTTAATATLAGSATAATTATPTTIATTVAATIAATSTVPATTTAAPTTTSAPTTTVAPTTTQAAPTTVPGTGAADVLAAIPVAAERTGGFAASQFATAPSADGCDLSTHLLRRDSATPVQTAADAPCTIVAGSWTSPYDGTTTADPGTLALDRPVTMREAWESGASTWTAAQRAAYASELTDRRTARMAPAATVRAKADRDPAGWLPDGAARCTYLADYLSVKARWGLSMDRAEATRVRSVLDTDCPGLVVSPWSAPPAPPELPTPTTVPYYLDCADAAAKGVTSIPRGAPGFRDALDGNGNGIACE